MTEAKKNKLFNILIFTILCIGAVVMIAPLLWMLSTSVKEKSDVFALPPVWIPEVFDFSKYKEIWEAGPLLSGIKNSLIISLSVTIVGSFTSSLAAFAFAKLRLKNKNMIFLLLLSAMMIPYPSLMIPQFSMFASIGWVDTLLPLIIPPIFGNIVMVFFLRQYLINVPNAVIEAAKIDGTSFFGIFIRIIVPLIKPAIAAQFILWFMAVWNDYLAPIIYLNSPDKLTIQLVIANFNATYAIQTDYPLIMAASIIALLPMLVIFLVFQKQIIESIAISGVKG
ncbi:sugar ABC transporter permease [Halolactibacillus miurensis]|uniref:Multiple sugar transport system permease protein n=1 Tax=Halolactibacillus miurensis TaxID=306541 RepID=A0A1I6Q786_9BACI|nr:MULTISPECIES: carbohydrate ABC transporter permease [Halolactibacillus]GEM03234.1 sugar ABC transporter permease [Halolactibacillus miurensis]SFS48307.1 multiple sugar transport system permease protein [Halolactibacillus miurensis]